MRGICLLSWSIHKEHDIQTLRIVFMIKDPKVELMYFEIPVKNSEEDSVSRWLAERVPPFWKNLTEKE